MGILIAIEGTDSSGKQTQSELVYNKLIKQGIPARLISFPAYESESSALVKMYLSGDFGREPQDVNAYTASTFYAVDRFATYRKDWKKDYDVGTVIVADRYVPSNMIHQASKIENKREKKRFIDWLVELEYGHFGLPIPDVTIFLNMPPQSAAKLMADRANKIDSSDKKDIHESNLTYLKKSYDNAVQVARARGWREVSCVDGDGTVRSIAEINADIMKILDDILKTA
ncbi:MAG: dTMP kinase [Candidatus Ornithomonoglobus sp.]